MLKFPSAIKELRFFLSQSGEASKPLKQFLQTNYPGLKKQNPTIPILVRESVGIPPSVTVRYEFGKEVKTNLDGLESKDIELTIKGFGK